MGANLSKRDISYVSNGAYNYLDSSKDLLSKDDSHQHRNSDAYFLYKLHNKCDSFISLPILDFNDGSVSL